MPRTRPPTRRRSATRSPAPRTAEPQFPPGFRLTHPDRVVYQDQGITKQDLAAYYASIAPWILPQVAGRPLALLRCPGGVGDCFIQKRPPQGMPVAVERLDIAGSDGVEQHLAIKDLEGLLWLVQFGTVEIHVWGARASDVDRPDRMVFDLDPDAAVGWREVVDTARVVRDLLSELGLVSFVKTTGGKGLHVVAPLARRHSWPEVKSFAKGVADLLVATAPSRYVATSSKAARRGKLFVDYLRNDRGSLAVAAYSTRARDGAPVSTPVSWEELGSLNSAADFTLATLPRRLSRLRRDPWEGISQISQTLRAASRKRLERAAGA